MLLPANSEALDCIADCPLVSSYLFESKGSVTESEEAAGVLPVLVLVLEEDSCPFDSE